MGIRCQSILRNIFFSSRCANDSAVTPGANANLSIRAISSALLLPLPPWPVIECETECEMESLRSGELSTSREKRSCDGFSDMLAVLSQSGEKRQRRRHKRKKTGQHGTHKVACTQTTSNYAGIGG